MDQSKKEYKAIIWKQGTPQPGLRVSVEAVNLAEAKNLLELEYGKGNVFNLYNEEEADRIRQA